MRQFDTSSRPRVPLLLEWLRLAAITVVASCSAPGDAERSDTVAWPDTVDATWVATSIAKGPLVPGTRVTLQTSASGMGGYTGCNWYGVRPDSAGGRPLIEMTARGCRSDIQDQERRFTLLLPQARWSVRRGDTLIVLDSVRSELISFVKRDRTSATPEQLAGSAWRLRVSTNRAVGTDSVTLRFAADSVSGFGGCRDYIGTYSARGDVLRFTYLSMRQENCASDRRRIAEEHLTTVFSETSNFEVRRDTLVLTTFGGDTLRFTRLSR